MRIEQTTAKLLLVDDDYDIVQVLKMELLKIDF